MRFFSTKTSVLLREAFGQAHRRAYAVGPQVSGYGVVSYFSERENGAVNSWRMALRVEKISAVTFRVLNMKASVRFYGDVLGMQIVYGEDAFFSSLRVKDGSTSILIL